MKFCQKCGKEIMDEAVICPGCGCAVVSPVETKEVNYDDCVKGATTTNVVSGIILAIGLICSLIVNAWLGGALCLVAEILALIPNSKLQKTLKSNLNGMEKGEFKNKAKEIKKDLKSQYSAFKFSFIIAYVALALLIISMLFV